jgi:hypothetical protein
MDIQFSNLRIKEDDEFEEFPLYFKKKFHPDLFLIREDRGRYKLMPHNQLDWQFEIKSDFMNNEVWYVLGIKDGVFGMEEMSKRYQKTNTNLWTGTNWYP